MEEVASIFANASRESKLAFIRDAQSFGQFFDQEEVKEYVREQLLEMGLMDERERILFPD